MRARTFLAINSWNLARCRFSETWLHQVRLQLPAVLIELLCKVWIPFSFHSTQAAPILSIPFAVERVVIIRWRWRARTKLVATLMDVGTVMTRQTVQVPINWSSTIRAVGQELKLPIGIIGCCGTLGGMWWCCVASEGFGWWQPSRRRPGKLIMEHATCLVTYF